MNAISFFRKFIFLPDRAFRYPVICFLLLLNFQGISSQVLQDSAALRQVKETVSLIYNMRFTEALAKCNSIIEKYPGHPVTYLLKGTILYWENYPLIDGSETGSDFEEQINLCINACDDFMPENEAEFLLANLCARGILLAYYTANDVQSKAFSLGRTTYRYFRKSLKFTGIFPDFQFFTGLYNYYREAYPQAHPAYKPVFAIFPSGDIEKGLNELRTAFRKAIFLRAEASTFLSSIYKYFENDYITASQFSSAIYIEYPRNTVYLINAAEDLLLAKKYDEAEKLIESPLSSKAGNYFEAQIRILKGIIYEKKYNELTKAEQEYWSGIKKIGEYGEYGDQYAAYAWFGLSRISGHNDDRHNERYYRRKARDLTDFENVSFDD